jgi:hypothetical protein
MHAAYRMDAVLMDAKINIKYFDQGALDFFTELDPHSQFAVIINDMHVAAANAVSAADTIMEAKRFKGELYPLRARHAMPLPAKGELIIYALIDPRDDTVFYVGQTNNFPLRLKTHLQFDTRYLHNPNRADQRKLELCSHDQPIIAAVLCCAADERNAEFLEALAIRAFYRTTQNTHRNRSSLNPRYGRGK